MLTAITKEHSDHFLIKLGLKLQTRAHTSPVPPSFNPKTRAEKENENEILQIEPDRAQIVKH